MEWYDSLYTEIICLIERGGKVNAIRKKLIFTVIATVLVFVTAVSTTFAWFSMNDSAWVDEFKLDIQTTDHLLIGYKDGEFKQALNNSDVVMAINGVREESSQINSLADISLSPVTSLNGTDFLKQEFAYDEQNRASIYYQQAEENSYVKMRLYFSFSTTNLNEDGTHPDYELHFKKPVAEQDGIKGTRFNADNQVLELVHSLTTLDGTLKQGDTLVVNPVNALRIGVKSQDSDLIIEYANDQNLGSYAFSDNCETNAMFTYFNNVHNNCLKPMDDASFTEDSNAISLLNDKLKTNLDDSLGVFTYDSNKGDYNSIAVDITLWIEGFDADNLIGLDTTAIDCLLSFTVVEKE